MISHAVSYHRHRFPAEIISHAVWLYHRFCLSFRDTEDLLAQRGITVSYEAIRQWCRRFGPAYARILRRRQSRVQESEGEGGEAGLPGRSTDGEPARADCRRMRRAGVRDRRTRCGRE